MRGRYVVRITPDDVGARVTIRSRTHADPPATDTLGHLLSWRDGTLAVRKRDGTVVHISEADLLAARTIPPAAPRPPR